jgi:hypothetical protein
VSEEPVVTRQSYARPSADARPARPAAPARSRHPADVERLLTLQRQIGNAAVGRLLAQRVEASDSDSEYFDARSTASEAPYSYEGDEFYDARDDAGPSGSGPDLPAIVRGSLDGQPPLAVDLTPVLPPAPALPPVVDSTTPPGSPVRRPASIYEPPESTTPPGSPTRRPASVFEPMAVEEPQAEPSRFRQVVDGDEAKMAGSGLAIAGPATGLANNSSPSLGLMAGATGGAATSAFGDAVSELLKGYRSPEGYSVVNWAKVLGGVLAFGGLVVASGGIGGATPGVRAAGMIAQSAGLLVKSAGEGYKFEKGSAPWKGMWPDADIAKAAGAFIAAAGPALAAGAFLSEPELAKMLTGSALAAGTTGSSLMKAALWFSVGSGAGDFFSEVIKGVNDGQVNPAKLWGGFLQATGAVTFANGALLRNLDARNAGLALQIAGLTSKSLGEGRKLEQTAPVNYWPKMLTKTKVNDSPV